MRNNSSIFGNFDDLYLFCAVVENGSVSKCAARLNLPNSTVSRRMRDLEERLGEKLLAPVKRELVPTQRGRELFEACFGGMWQVDRNLAAFRSSGKGLMGTVRLTVPRAFYYGIVRKCIHDIQSEHPRVHFDVRINQLPNVAELDSDTDIIVAFNLEGLETYVARPIYRTKLGIFAHKDFFDPSNEPKCLEDLQAFPWISNYNVHEIGIYREDQFETMLKVDVRTVVNDVHAVSDEVRACQGIGMIPSAMARKHRDLRRIFPEFNAEIRQAYVVYRKTKYQPAVVVETAARLQIEAQKWFARHNDWEADEAYMRELAGSGSTLCINY